MFRFSLTTFLVAIALVAVVCSGLVYPSGFWVQIVGSLTLTLLVAAVITAFAWQEPKRWFWVGFAIAGWSYLPLAFAGGDETRDVLLTQYAVSQLDQMMETSTPLRTPTGELITHAGDQIYVDYMTPLSLKEAEKRGLLRYAYTMATVPSRESFDQIGHFAWAWVLGCLGGLLSLWLRRRSTTAVGAT